MSSRPPPVTPLVHYGLSHYCPASSPIANLSSWMHPHTSGLRIKGWVGDNCSLYSVCFVLRFHWEWHDGILVNVTMHTPNLHPIWLQQCSGLNQCLMDMGLRSTTTVHQTQATTPLAPYHHAVSPSSTCEGRWSPNGNTCPTSIIRHFHRRCPGCLHLQQAQQSSSPATGMAVQAAGLTHPAGFWKIFWGRDPSGPISGYSN